MNQFNEFNIEAEYQSFTGEKITIDRIINKQIVVYDYKIEKSKFEGKGNRLDMQISVDGQKRVVFTGSKVLMSMIDKVPKNKFPFTTTIVKEDKRLEFT